MTRKSKRELERAVERLGADQDRRAFDPLLVYEDPETGDLYMDSEGTSPVDADEVDPVAILPTDLDERVAEIQAAREDEQ